MLSVLNKSKLIVLKIGLNIASKELFYWVKNLNRKKVKSGVPQGSIIFFNLINVRCFLDSWFNCTIAWTDNISNCVD